MNQRGGRGGRGHPRGGSSGLRCRRRFGRTLGRQRREKRRGKKKKKGKKRAEAGGSAKNSAEDDQNSTVEEEDRPRTVERKIYRGHKTRKLRKLNDGGKLELVQVKTHSSLDYSDMVLRPKGQKRRKNAKGRRVTTDDILECEGGRLDP